MEVSLNNIRKNIRMRGESDRQIPITWLLVYILSLFFSVVVSGFLIASFLNIFSTIDFSDPQSYYYLYDWFSQEYAFVWIMVGLSGIVNLGVSMILNYLLVNRRSTHFKRQKFLSKDIITAIGSLAKTKDIDVEVNLSSLDRIMKEVNIWEIEKNPILWAILSAFVPFAQLYVYYFLVNDFYRHERRDDLFWNDISMVLNKLGANFSLPQRTEAIPARNFVLYLILTIVTSGLFMVYLLYVQLKDPNEHFKHHIQTENQLLITMESVAS